MAARDIFHNAVKQGLIKDGWTITHDPLSLKFGLVDMYVDLAAENLLAAMRENQYIAVEIKSFIGASTLSEVHSALGQFINYRIALESQYPEHKLYLAVPLDIYSTFFQDRLAQTVMQRYDLSVIAYDSEKEVIVKWID
jgi:XisH protein